MFGRLIYLTCVEVKENTIHAFCRQQLALIRQSAMSIQRFLSRYGIEPGFTADMGGSEVYDRLAAIKQDVQVILSSGYSIDELVQEILDRGCG